MAAKSQVAGSVVAGFPSPAEQYLEPPLDLNELLVKRPAATFDALQAAGQLEWLGCSATGEAVSAMLEAGRINPQFADWAEVVARVQWLFLMCGIRLNEVIVQVDPYTDEEWRVRKEEIDRKRSEERAFMEGRRAAQKAWAAHLDSEIK